LRLIVAQTLSLDQRPTLEGVVPGSPADIADLRAGDVIIGLDGHDWAEELSARVTPEVSPTYSPVAQARSRLSLALASGSASLRVSRQGVAIDRRLSSVLGCDVTVELIPSSRMSASSDGGHVYVTTAFVAYAGSADALAMIIGHEIAHGLLRERKTGGVTGGQGGLFKRRSNERDADEVGLYLAARAGYDPAVAARFWRRFGAEHPLAPLLDPTHPTPGSRASDLERLASEIAARRLRGEMLIPPKLLPLGD
jgi:hypothetical protein